MKYIITLLLLILFIFSHNIVFAQPGSLENPDRPCMDSGDGRCYNPGDTQKTSNEIFEDFLDIFFKRPTGGTNGSEGTPRNNSTGPSTNPSSIPTPLNSLTPFPTNVIPSQTPGGKPVDQTFTAIQTFYDYVGQKVSVPTCVIEAISYMEYTPVLKYTPEQVNQYIQPGQKIPNCPWNSCSAAGHMQMTIGTDERGSTSCNRCCWNGKCLNSCPNAWGSYGNAVNQYDGASHQSNVCNLRDSTFAAAKKLKQDSGTQAGNRNWDQNAIFQAGKRYFGECKTPFQHLGNRTYCEFIIHQCTL